MKRALLIVLYTPPLSEIPRKWRKLLKYTPHIQSAFGTPDPNNDLLGFPNVKAELEVLSVEGDTTFTLTEFETQPDVGYRKVSFYF